MDASLLRIVGQVAGIGGVALGIFLIVLRNIIRKKIFPTLPPAQAYRLLRFITIAAWSVAIAGVCAWVYVKTPGSVVATDCAIAIGGNVGGATVQNNCPPAVK